MAGGISQEPKGAMAAGSGAAIELKAAASSGTAPTVDEEEEEGGYVLVDVPLGAAAAAATPEEQPRRTVGEAADDGPFPYWRKPSLRTLALNAFFDLLCWPAYLIIGISADHFKASGILSAFGSLGGLCTQYYRYSQEKSLRIFPKMHSTLMSLAWIVHGMWCAGVSRATAQQYSLFFVMSGVLVAGIISLATNRPVLLEEALEHVTSRQEEQHPIFRHCRLRLSQWLLITNALQWPCFLVAAFIVPDASEMVLLTLRPILPVGMLIVYIVGAVAYGFVQHALLNEALRTGATSADGMDVAAVTTKEAMNILETLRSRFLG